MFVICKGSSAQGSVGGMADAAANVGRSLHHQVSPTERPSLSGRSRLHVRQESAPFQTGTAGIWELWLRPWNDSQLDFGIGVCSIRMPRHIAVSPYFFFAKNLLRRKLRGIKLITCANGRIKEEGEECTCEYKKQIRANWMVAEEYNFRRFSVFVICKKKENLACFAGQNLYLIKFVEIKTLQNRISLVENKNIFACDRSPRIFPENSWLNRNRILRERNISRIVRKRALSTRNASRNASRSYRGNWRVMYVAATEATPKFHALVSRVENQVQSHTQKLTNCTRARKHVFHDTYPIYGYLHHSRLTRIS